MSRASLRTRAYGVRSRARVKRGAYVEAFRHDAWLAWCYLRNHPVMLVGALLGCLIYVWVILQTGANTSQINKNNGEIVQIFQSQCPPVHPVPARCRALLQRLLDFATPAQRAALRGVDRRGVAGSVGARRATGGTSGLTLVPGGASGAGASGPPQSGATGRGQSGGAGPTEQTGPRGQEGPPGSSGSSASPAPSPPAPPPAPPPHGGLLPSLPPVVVPSLPRLPPIVLPRPLVP